MRKRGALWGNLQLSFNTPCSRQPDRSKNIAARDSVALTTIAAKSLRTVPFQKHCAKDRTDVRGYLGWLQHFPLICRISKVRYGFKSEIPQNHNLSTALQ